MSLNFILHGECNVGKTSLRNRWVDGIFTGDVAPTFGVDFNIKTLDLVQEVEEEGEEEEDEEEVETADETQPEVVGGKKSKQRRPKKQAPSADLQVKINVYDTSGKPGYRAVNSTYLLAFDAVLFVYDISSMSTLDVSRTCTVCVCSPMYSSNERRAALQVNHKCLAFRIRVLLSCIRSVEQGTTVLYIRVEQQNLHMHCMQCTAAVVVQQDSCVHMYNTRKQTFVCAEEGVNIRQQCTKRDRTVTQHYSNADKNRYVRV